MKKINLDLSPQYRGLKEHPKAPNCGRHHMNVLPGYGDRNFRFPDKQTLVNNALARLEQRYGGTGVKGAKIDEVKNEGTTDSAEETDLFGGDATGEKFTGKDAVASEPADDKPLVRHRIQIDRTILPGHPNTGFNPERVISKLPEAEQRNTDGTLFIAVSGIAIMMDEGKYDAIVAERFDPLAGAVNWAKEHMEARYQPAIISLAKQLDQLQKLYKEALPRVLAVLTAQNPEVHPKRLEAAAVEVLDEELAQILTVLRIWTDAFAQRRDGMYKQLRAITFVVEQAFRLHTQCAEGSCEQRIQTVVFQVGNVFVARFSNQGPATLPGTRGPIGAHAIEVPHDERDMIALMLVIYSGHELRHNIFADVDGLAAEVTHTVVSQIQEAFAAGKFKFSTDKVVFGANKFDTIDIIAKMFADTIGEVDADISGGVLQSGPTFLYNIISTFSAMNAGVDGVLRNAPLLRSSSYYELATSNGQTSLEFLPHPPDYIRAYIVAAALDEIGFPAEATECRHLADQAYGAPLPKFISWSDVEGKSKAVIKIPVEDLKQVAPIVAKALIRTPMKALGGACMWDIVNWTPKRQEKVEKLMKILMAGGSEVPTDMGDVYGTYIGPAATMAYWGLCKSGVRPLVALKVVNDNALKMIDTVRERQEALDAAADTAATKEVVKTSEPDCTCEHGDDDTSTGADEPAPGADESADEENTTSGADESAEDEDATSGADESAEEEEAPTAADKTDESLPKDKKEKRDRPFNPHP